MTENKTEETDTAITLPVMGEVQYREIHAFEDGLYCGVQGAREHEYGREKHYWRTGWLLGDAYDRYLRDE